MKLWQSLKKPLISICVPCRDTVHSGFMSNLVSLLQHASTAAYDVNFLMLQGSLISAQRQKLAELAKEQKSKYILWLDSDMLFPSNIIDLLLAHQKDIVACNYSTRLPPYKGVAYQKIGDWNSWVKPSMDVTLLSVEAVGMGCMLVHTDVFDKLDKPWFEVFYSHELQNHIGEDFYFCINARKKNYEIFIDCAASQMIKHLGTAEFDSKLWTLSE